MNFSKKAHAVWLNMRLIAVFGKCSVVYQIGQTELLFQNKSISGLDTMLFSF